MKTGILVGLMLLLSSHPASQTSVIEGDSNSTRMLERRLRIIAPRVLELSWVGASDETTGAPPLLQLSPADVAVTVDHRPVMVSAVGFTQRASYAPLARWDLRVTTFLYFKLEQPVKVGQTVHVTLPKQNFLPQTISRRVTVHRVSPTIHVSQMGYTPGLPKKASLFPFVRQGSVDVSGGHHDAGIGSKRKPYGPMGVGCLLALLSTSISQS